MSDASLELLLKALRLPFMAEQWEHLEQQANAQGWSYSQYLRFLCEQEQIGRDNRRLQRYLKNSKLPTGKSISNFDFSACPGLERRRIMQLTSNTDWVKRGKTYYSLVPAG